MTPGGNARKQPAREHIAADLANDLVALLDAGAEIDVRSQLGETLRRSAWRPATSPCSCAPTATPR